RTVPAHPSPRGFFCALSRHGKICPCCYIRRRDARGLPHEHVRVFPARPPHRGDCCTGGRRCVGEGDPQRPFCVVPEVPAGPGGPSCCLGSRSRRPPGKPPGGRELQHPGLLGG